MTKRFIDKAPADEITVEFDFTEYAAAVSLPEVSVSVLIGTDASATAILDGTPTTIGAKVYQRIVGGVNGVEYLLQCLAYNGTDRYSIEAVLPVRVRPVAVTEQPVYLSEAQFEQRYSATELADLLDDGTSYVRAENDAASLINGYLSTRYTLPLVSVPVIVQGWAGDITRFRLWRDRAPEEVRQRYDDALASLKLLAQGVIALPPGSDGVPQATGLAFGGFAADRVFTSDSLAGF